MTVRVRLDHARQILRRSGRPICREGIEAWCLRYGVDWDAFTGEGVPAEVFEAIDDHWARLVVAIARKEASE